MIPQPRHDRRHTVHLLLNGIDVFIPFPIHFDHLQIILCIQIVRDIIHRILRFLQGLHSVFHLLHGCPQPLSGLFDILPRIGSRPVQDRIIHLIQAFHGCFHLRRSPFDFLHGFHRLLSPAFRFCDQLHRRLQTFLPDLMYRIFRCQLPKQRDIIIDALCIRLYRLRILLQPLPFFLRDIPARIQIVVQLLQLLCHTQSIFTCIRHMLRHSGHHFQHMGYPVSGLPRLIRIFIDIARCLIRHHASGIHSGIRISHQRIQIRSHLCIIAVHDTRQLTDHIMQFIHIIMYGILFIQLQVRFHLPYDAADILPSQYRSTIGAVGQQTGLSAEDTADIISGVLISDRSVIGTADHGTFGIPRDPAGVDATLPPQIRHIRTVFGQILQQIRTHLIFLGDPLRTVIQISGISAAIDHPVILTADPAGKIIPGQIAVIDTFSDLTVSRIDPGNTSCLTLSVDIPVKAAVQDGSGIDPAHTTGHLLFSLRTDGTVDVQVFDHRTFPDVAEKACHITVSAVVYAIYRMTVSVKMSAEYGDRGKSAATEPDILHQYHIFVCRETVDMTLLRQSDQVFRRFDLDPFSRFLPGIACTLRKCSLISGFIAYRTAGISCGYIRCISKQHSGRRHDREHSV